MNDWNFVNVNDEKTFPTIGKYVLVAPKWSEVPIVACRTTAKVRINFLDYRGEYHKWDIDRDCIEIESYGDGGGYAVCTLNDTEIDGWVDILQTPYTKERLNSEK